MNKKYNLAIAGVVIIAAILMVPVATAGGWCEFDINKAVKDIQMKVNWIIGNLTLVNSTVNVMNGTVNSIKSTVNNIHDLVNDIKINTDRGVAITTGSGNITIPSGTASKTFQILTISVPDGYAVNIKAIIVNYPQQDFTTNNGDFIGYQKFVTGLSYSGNFAVDSQLDSNSVWEFDYTGTQINIFGHTAGTLDHDVVVYYAYTATTSLDATVYIYP
jgi:hypothetical protein